MSFIQQNILLPAVPAGHSGPIYTRKKVPVAHNANNEGIIKYLPKDLCAFDTANVRLWNLMYRPKIAIQIK